MNKQQNTPYVVSYSGGPLNHETDLTSCLDPIYLKRYPGGKYIFQDYGAEGDVVFVWVQDNQES